jgi:L-aminopeptidase/D-esterase-like protein
MELPTGFSCGHWTDPVGLTGCTVILAPPGAVGSGEVRGGGPGTRESDLLSPWTSTAGPQAVVLTGGSAFGLAACDGVAGWLAEAGRGHPTPAGRVPLVAGAVVYDLMIGDPVHPDAAAGRAACEAAHRVVERGHIGAGTGATVGKLLGPDGWSLGGVGAASLDAREATVACVAVANAIGDVIDADGTVLAGAHRDGHFVSAIELIASGALPPIQRERANTTLACLCTDAKLTKLEAYMVARAMNAGLARAVSPAATGFDGDMTFVLASGAVEADLLTVSTMAAEATALAIRDAVRSVSDGPARDA